MDEIGENEQINNRWNQYCKKVKYTADLSFKEVVASIKAWIDSAME